MSDMINLRSLMEPFFPGTKVTDEDWERIFGKDSGHGKIEKPLDCEGVDPGAAKGKTDSIKMTPEEQDLKRRVDATPINLENIKAWGIMYLESLYHLSKYQVRRKLAVEARDTVELEKIKADEKPAIELVTEAQKRAKLARVAIRKMYDNSSDARAKIDAKSKEDIVWWINAFAWGHDPRLVNIGVSSFVPFILFPAQEKFVLWMMENYRQRQPMLVEKSRAMGITECCVMFDIHQWLFTNGYVGAWGSRTEDLVDSKGDPDAIFTRLRRVLYHLPVLMRPEGFEREVNPFDNVMRLRNPRNGNVILGQGGDNMGAGGRSSIFKIDEKAAVEHQDKVDAAVSYNTNCQVDISTPNPMGQDAFYRKRMSGRVQVFTAGWWLDPSKNPKHDISFKTGNRFETESDWYRYEELTKDPLLLASQVDINYSASITDAVIPSDWVNAAIGFGLEQQGIRSVGFDISAGGANKTVAIHRIGPVVLPPKIYTSESIITNFWQAIDDAENFRAWTFNYDMAGIGKSAHDMAKSSDRRFKFRVNGILGNQSAGDEVISSEGRKMKDKFRNYRAVLWWNLRERFRKTYEHKKGIRFYSPSDMISIPDDQVLVSELSAVKLEPSESGKIGVESKQHMRARGVESPDHADALVYSFADNNEESVAGSFDYKEESQHIKKINVNWERENASKYVSVYMADPLHYVGIGALWHDVKCSLRVLLEWEFSGEAPDKMVSQINSDFRSEIHEIREWIGNKEMFPVGDNLSSACPYFLFKKIGAPLHRNYSNHEAGSLMVLAKMFEQNMITVNEDCASTVFQLSNWNIRSGAPKEGFFFAACLAQLVTRLKAGHKIPEAILETEYGQKFSTSGGTRRRVE